MGDTEKKVDSWYAKIQKYLTAKISSFVAFLFLLVAAGAWAGLMMASLYPEMAFLAVLIPAAAGIVAYYNRTLATILFFGLIIFFFFL